MLLKTRPDVLWSGPPLTGARSLEWLAAALCAAPRTILTLTLTPTLTPTLT